jgi:hypothetical protein
MLFVLKAFSACLLWIVVVDQAGQYGGGQFLGAGGEVEDGVVEFWVSRQTWARGVRG